ncbi:MAG: FtsX-like permease family protein [Acidobacteria bacterium]|nr:FtsX-like permease family protein [Acidobacteriota bacterium]
MAIYWQKAIRDFWLERTRTVLVVVAIAIGIAAFSTVMSSYAILTRELDKGYLATNPASFTLVADKVDEALMAAVATHPGVAVAEARRTVSGRIKSGPVEWRSLVLFVVNDYGDIRVSRLVPQSGAWPPATGEILIERDAMQVAKTRIGDTVTIKTVNGEEHQLRLSGTTHDVTQAQARMENIVYGYITLATLAQLGEEPYLDRVNVVVTEPRFSEPHIRAIADEVKTLAEAQGHTVRRVDVPKPGKHPHTDIMGLLLMAMAGFGLFALILSGVLVINLLTALMAAQVRQIGVMKAVGGTRRQIARIYFAQALLLGAAAIVIALPVGLLGSRVLCRYLAVFLNFDIVSFAVPVWVYALVVLVGAIVPLLAAAYPVWRGSGVSIREALADYGVARNAFGTNGFDRILAGMSGLARPLLLAIRNSFRRRARLALTLLTLAVSGLFFMAALNVRASMIHTLDRLFATRQFDLLVAFNTMVSMESVERAARNTPGVKAVEGWIFTQASIADASKTPASSGGHGGTGGGLHGGGAPAADSFSVIGLPDNTAMFKPDITAGRNLLPGETDTIVLNSALAGRNPQWCVGNSINLRMGPAEKLWRIVGIAQEPFSPAVAYVPRRYFDEAGGHDGMANSVRMTLDRTDRSSINQVKTDLEQNLEREGLRAQGSNSKGDSRYGFDQHMVMIYWFLIVMSCILAGVGGLGLMTTMSLNVLERRREMGVLRAIGATPRTVWMIVVAEGAVIGLLSWALAGLAAWPVSKALGDLILMLMFKTRLSFLFELRGLWIWLVVSLCLCAVASFLPAWRASRQSVREAIGYE